MAGTDSRRHKVDWVRIRRDYATGRYTDVELAAKHNTAREVISRRRRADRLRNPASWPVDLRADVQRATAALLMQQQVTRTVAQGSEAESVLAAAQIARDVILRHRTTAGRAREITSALLAELADVTKHRHDLGKLIERAASTLDDAEAAALTAQVRQLVTLHNRVGSIQKLADSMAKLHTLERKAFGISDDDGGSNPLDAMTTGELEAEVARLSQQLAQAGGAPG